MLPGIVNIDTHTGTAHESQISVIRLSVLLYLLSGVSYLFRKKFVNVKKCEYLEGTRTDITKSVSTDQQFSSQSIDIDLSKYINSFAVGVHQMCACYQWGIPVFVPFFLMSHLSKFTSSGLDETINRRKKITGRQTVFHHTVILFICCG